MLLWDHLIPDSQKHCLLYSSEDFFRKSTGKCLSNMEGDHHVLAKSWHRNLPHAPVSSWLPVSMLEIPGKRGKQYHAFPGTHTNTPTVALWGVLQEITRGSPYCSFSSSMKERHICFFKLYSLLKLFSSQEKTQAWSQVFCELRSIHR